MRRLIEWWRLVKSFEVFLEERFRIFGIEEPGTLLKRPIYGLAIRYPNRGRIKEYDFYITRDGKIDPFRSITLDLREWNSGRKITCVNTNGEIKR